MKTNHPAHGPVSLDRLHQISEILSKAAAQSDGGNLGYAMADAVKVIDGVIASFGAEPAPLQLPVQHWEELCRQHPDMSIGDAIIRASWWNHCAAMLQAEPVSNRDELPLDYLQGHKDGLEWAAQLAEANHPQTGDWLYDDPIELARVIRKGPDMPEFKSVSVDEDDNFYSWFGRFWYENYQKNNYTTSAKQMLGTMAEFAYRAGRESEALASNSPVTPDGWIPVSERMPNDKDFVWCWGYVSGWTESDGFEAYYDATRNKWWAVDDEPVRKVTHWTPLPAAPRQEVKS